MKNDFLTLPDQLRIWNEHLMVAIKPAVFDKNNFEEVRGYKTFEPPKAGKNISRED